MGIFRTTVEWKFPIGSGGGTNTWHLRTLSDDGTTTEVQALMGLVSNFYYGIRGAFPSDTTWYWDGLAAQIATPTPRLLEGAVAWQITGSAPSNDYGPAPGMICVTWRTALATKRGRGRTFLGPVARPVMEANGTIADPIMTTVRTEAAALVSASLSDTNGALGVWSETDGVLRDFVASNATDQVAVLRSRR